MARIKTFVNGGSLLPSDLNAIQDYVSSIDASLTTFSTASLPAILNLVLPVGSEISGGYSALPALIGGFTWEWQWADGALIDKTTYATYFASVGHAYNGGVDPGSNKVRKSDKRGRAAIGADNMGAGAAGRLPNSLRARGQSGGEEQHVISLGELASHGHSTGAGGNGKSGTENSSLAHGHFLLAAAAGRTPNVGGASSWIGAVAQAFGSGVGINVPAQLGNDVGDVNGTSTNGPSAHDHNVTVNNNGGGGAHNNLQPYEVNTVLVRVK